MLSELHLPQLKSNNEQFKVILKISHGIYAKRTKRDENLEFLGSSIKKCLSNDISKKYKGIPSDAIILFEYYRIIIYFIESMILFSRFKIKD